MKQKTAVVYKYYFVLKKLRLFSQFLILFYIIVQLIFIVHDNTLMSTDIFICLICLL